MNFKVVYKSSAIKELAKIQKQQALKIKNAVDKLEYNPFPVGCKKLIGNEDKYRIRVGDYRVLYSIEETILTILIIKIGHRKNIYKL